MKVRELMEIPKQIDQDLEIYICGSAVNSEEPVKVGEVDWMELTDALLFIDKEEV